MTASRDRYLEIDRPAMAALVEEDLHRATARLNRSRRSKSRHKCKGPRRIDGGRRPNGKLIE